MNLPKPVLHVRLPYVYIDKEEDEIRDGLKNVAKDYVVILTSDSESGKTEMEVHWILPKELSEEKADEIIKTINNLK